MHDNPWLHEEDLDDAAAQVARRFDLDDDHARDLVGVIANALEDSQDAIDDATWHVDDELADIAGEDFVEDVATTLGYDDFLD
ncbi:hypothetical protein ACPZ19_18825 [Amycolatopsis lurida]